LYAVLGLPLVVLVLIVRLNAGQSLMPLGLSVALTGILGLAIGTSILEIRWRRRWRTARAMLCPNCLYPFPEEGDTRCPECGFAAGRDAIQEIWTEQQSRLESNRTMGLALLGDGLDGYPAAIARQRRKIIFYNVTARVAMALAVLSLTIWFNTNFISPPRGVWEQRIILLYTILAMLVAIYVVFILRCRRLERRWQDSIADPDRLLCPACLAELVEPGACRACGDTTPRERVQELWAEERARVHWPKRPKVPPFCNTRIRA